MVVGSLVLLAYCIVKEEQLSIGCEKSLGHRDVDPGSEEASAAYWIYMV